jgi:hypothetical protein
MTGRSSSPPAWVTAFFGGTNALRWSDIQAGIAPDGWGQDVLGWLPLLERDEDAAGMLPHLDANGTVVWYGVARSDRGARRLVEDLRGFVGASYGGFDARPYVPAGDDAAGLVLAAAFPAALYCIAPEQRRTKSVRRTLGIYRSLLKRKPSSNRLAARSVGALRTRFDRALLAGNEAEADRLYEEILATGRLSLENRHYLRVRLLRASANGRNSPPRRRFCDSLRICSCHPRSGHCTGLISTPLRIRKTPRLQLRSSDRRWPLTAGCSRRARGFANRAWLRHSL